MLSRNLSSIFLAFQLGLFSGAIMADVDEMVREATDYVESLAKDCVYLDGYICQAEGPKPGESSRVFAHATDDSGTLPALLVQVWPAAYAHFLADQNLNDQQKQLMHYRIGFSKEANEAIVLFRPLFLPQMQNGEVVGTMRATIGRELRINVDLNTLKVTRSIYGK
ncbi:MAG: hypothetical protein HOM55_07920 [Proteobacteria bacterium]|jgi:hypothetical protein|nr:hypothetical protein [Pseudomonadota bacterium]